MATSLLLYVLSLLMVTLFCSWVDVCSCCIGWVSERW